jgi:hypothetical protein
VIKRSLSASGILSRLTGGRRNGFSSPFACFDFGAITTIVPAKNNVSRDDYRWGQLTETEKNGVKFSGAMSG